MINPWLESLSKLISESLWLAPVLALMAGILTSVTPCSLSTLPLIIGYVGGTGNDNPKKAFRLSLVFASGMAITFTALGTAASLLGRLIGTSGRWWYIALGVLMVLMALQTWEIYNFIPSTYLTGKSTKKGYIGALIAGILGGLFSSPCATPVLVVLLGIVAKKGSIAWGVLLLLLYSIGNSVLILITGTSVAFIKRITSGSKYGTFSKILKIVMGSLILLIGFYMFYLGF
ncbi:MAG TPA: cytochrome c biogenesis protein CcdA [Acetivibrio sp.]|jgi:cytochrome c-type biogenesis protein|nr:cytochrome c biogenesis protein CcdA [Clostridium sp.]HOQ38156.1 cytochrome c biogenesis protein CcdA [Acetivibrio sp.]HPT90927.1 cytochrome c biogenesis protein CcdA [Acetivibrio sp.]HQA58836.1 cytochrome c biogenesis protein CcdA [Acetivibrio sp.]